MDHGLSAVTLFYIRAWPCGSPSSRFRGRTSDSFQVRQAVIAAICRAKRPLPSMKPPVVHSRRRGSRLASSLVPNRQRCTHAWALAVVSCSRLIAVDSSRKKVCFCGDRPNCFTLFGLQSVRTADPTRALPRRRVRCADRLSMAAMCKANCLYLVGPFPRPSVFRGE